MDRQDRSVKWRFVTADMQLKQGRCELIYAFLSPSGASTANDIYDGISTNGDRIVRLEAAGETGLPFNPPTPIPCNKGLFVDVGTNTTGILVIWRDLE